MQGLAFVQSIRNRSKSSRSLAEAISAGLRERLAGPHGFTFVTRHTAEVHATHHAPHTATVPPLSSPFVGVDGSCVTLPDSSLRAAGAAAFFGQPVPGCADAPAYIATCLFGGPQNAANAECCACTLALQTLHLADHLVVGWDHLNAVTHMNRVLPATAPAATAGAAT